MTQTLIGLDYEGVASVKISTDAYDPATTPDTVYGAWLYNSKFNSIRPVGNELMIDQPGGPSDQYFPAGSNEDTFDLKIENKPFTEYIYNFTFFNGLDYKLPVFQKRLISFDEKYYNRTYRGYYGYQDRSGYEVSASGYSTKWSLNQNGRSLTSGGPDLDKNGNPIANQVLQVWNLPGNDESIKDPPLAPVSGQTSVTIDSTTCRVAKPGYDANVATPSQLAFDSATLPVKVIAANDVAVPQGVSSVPLGNVPDDCLVDVHFYAGNEIFYPISPFFQSADYGFVGANHWVSGGSLNFDNQDTPCRARFMVYSSRKNPAPTYGDNDVFRQFNDGTQDVVQFLRPGASANPSFDDIIVDSRWPALRIIKEGYIPINVGGAQEWPVSFDAGGAWPFVKFMTVHGYKEDRLGNVTLQSVREPFVKRLYTNRPGSNYGPAGDTSYCRLTNSEARFYTYRNEPVRVFYSDYDDYRRRKLTYYYDDDPILGIRYYIFGIPQP